MPVCELVSYRQRLWCSFLPDYCQLFEIPVTFMHLYVWFLWYFWNRSLISQGSFGHVHPAKFQISLRIRAVWSESSLVAFWIAKEATFFFLLFFFFFFFFFFFVCVWVFLFVFFFLFFLFFGFFFWFFFVFSLGQSRLIKLLECAGWFESSLGAHVRK